MKMISSDNENLIKRIKKIDFNPNNSNEILTLTYDINTVSYEQVYEIIRLLQHEFPKNKIIALPNNMSLKSCSKETLENIASIIFELTENL